MPATSIPGNWTFGLVAWVGLFPPTLMLPPSVHPFEAPPHAPPAADAKLPMCGLAPAKIQPNLCLVKYRISTNSPECQAFFDQGLGYLYSYVWMESARSFETACRCDPDCAMAWWGLSRALERYNKPSTAALKKAQALHVPGQPSRATLDQGPARRERQCCPTSATRRPANWRPSRPSTPCWRFTTTTRRAGTTGPCSAAGPTSSAARCRPCRFTRPCCGSTRCTPAPTTSWSISTKP